MFKHKLQDSRRYVGWTLLGVLIVAIVWTFSPGLPVLIGPWAWSGEKQRGSELFSHVWTLGDSLAVGDGLGPVFNASCHFQGGLGERVKAKATSLTTSFGKRNRTLLLRA